MSYAAYSHTGAGRTPSTGLVQVLRTFIAAWAETSAAYVAYQAVAGRGVQRADAARHAMGLPPLAGK